MHLRRLASINPRLLAIGLLAVFIGTSVGVGGYTFMYASASDYLTSDPAACANCHVMTDLLDGWVKSSHHDVAVCNDCHTPHDLVGKYSTKALNGYNHSRAFTTGRFDEPIQIKQRSLEIVEDNCRRCHGDLVQAIDGPRRAGDERIACVRCHASVGH